MVDKPEGCPPVTVIICTLNEAGNLQHVLPKIPRWVDEILLVDGHSTDKTVETAQQLCPRIRVLYQNSKGKGNAIKLGVNQAIGDIVVTLDADGQTNPEDIPRFIEPLLNEYDFAKGSRLAHGCPRNMPWHRWFGNKVLVTTCNMFHGTRYTDVCSGYNAFWKSAFLLIRLTRNGFGMEQEMMVKVKKAGLKVIEVEHHDVGRLGSNSKVSGIKQGFLDLWIVIKERF